MNPSIIQTIQNQYRNHLSEVDDLVVVLTARELSDILEMVFNFDDHRCSEVGVDDGKLFFKIRRK